MSKLVDSDNVKNIICKPHSLTVCGTVHIPSCDIRCDNESLNAKSVKKSLEWCDAKCKVNICRSLVRDLFMLL